MKEFPTLNTTMRYSEFKSTVGRIFRSPPCEDNLLRRLYSRFKPLKFSDDGRELDMTS